MCLSDISGFLLTSNAGLDRGWFRGAFATEYKLQSRSLITVRIGKKNGSRNNSKRQRVKKVELAFFDGVGSIEMKETE
jgi:hypothetical protein